MGGIHDHSAVEATNHGGSQLSRNHTTHSTMRVLALLVISATVLAVAVAIFWYIASPGVPFEKRRTTRPNVEELAKRAKRCETLSISVWEIGQIRKDVRVNGGKGLKVVETLRLNGRFYEYVSGETYGSLDVITAAFLDANDRELFMLRVHGGAVHVLIDGAEYCGEREDDSVANLLLGYVGLEPYPDEPEWGGMDNRL